jgi:hypothetical protein
MRLDPDRDGQSGFGSASVDDPGFQWESGHLCLTNFQKGSRTVKKLLSALVVAGFLAGLGCGDTSTPAKDKDKDKKGGVMAPAGGADKGKMGGDKAPKKEKDN